MNSLDYVVPTEDMQDGVAHRAARYYRFDKVKYNQQRSSLIRYKTIRLCVC